MSEDLELLKLRAKAKAKAEREREADLAAQSAMTPPIVDTSNVEDEPEKDPATLQQLKMQAAMGTALQIGEEGSAAAMGALESVPFAKDVLAGGVTLMENGTEKFEENYKANLRGTNEAINKAEEEYPFSFFAGDIGASMAIVNPARIPLALGVGGASALSRSEDRSVDDIIAGVAMTGAGMGAGHALGKGAHWFGKKLGLLADRGVGEAVGALNGSTKANLDRHVMKWYGDGVEDTLENATSKWAKDILGEKDIYGRPFLTVSTGLQEVSEKAGQLKDKYGKMMGSTLSAVDEQLGDAIDPKKAEKIYNELRSELLGDLTDLKDPNAQRLVKKIDARLGATFKEISEETEKITEIVQDKITGKFVPVTKEVIKDSPKFRAMTLGELHKTKQFVSKEVRNAFDKSASDIGAEAHVLRRYSAKLADIVDNEVDHLVKAGKIDIDGGEIKSFNTLKRKWANMHQVEELGWKAAAERRAGPFGIFKNALSIRGLAVGAIQAGTQLPTYAAATTAIAVNQAMSSPKFPARLQAGFRKLSEHLQKNPESPLLKRILVGTELSSDHFRENVSSVIGELNLMDSAMARTSDSVEMHSDSILTALDYHDKGAASALREALETGDKDGIGAVMDQVSKGPLGKYFPQGLGWDGKVYSPMDKQILEEQLKADNSISFAQKLMHLESLRQKGIIPQVQPDPKPPLQHIPRRKDRHEY